MGLFGYIVAKGVETAAKKVTIETLENATVNILAATAQNQSSKDDSVLKNGKLYIKPTRSSEDYTYQNALEIAKELLGAGFESVELKAIKKLGERSIKRYGEIQSVSINGKTDFLGIKKVPASSYIVIEYLDFKNSINLNIYQQVMYIKPGIIQNHTIIESNFADDNSNLKKFCCYCGKPIQNANAKFCSICGKEI